jgi:CRP-like cAMP-binding protein
VAAYHERALAFQPVEMRLAGVLLSFVEAHGAPAAGGNGAITLDLRLTYEMLARCLGVNTRSVDRTLAAWRRQGWLKKARGRYVFSSRAALEQRADPERLALFHRLDA